jgi:hypothetical protein
MELWESIKLRREGTLGTWDSREGAGNFGRA